MSVKHYKNGQLTLIAGSGGGGGEESFTGTKAEVEQAIAAGQIKENWTVYITDDIEEVVPDASDYKIEYITQEDYDALGEEKYENDIEYHITDGGINNVIASNIEYDNATSGLEAINVQGAVDELKEDVSTLNENLRIKTYIDISQFGCESTFIPDIAVAMPPHSYFCKAVTSVDNGIGANANNNFPYTSGVLTIEKTSSYVRVMFNGCNSGASTGTMYLANINLNTKEFNGWYILKELDFTTALAKNGRSDFIVESSGYITEDRELTVQENGYIYGHINVKSNGTTYSGCNFLINNKAITTFSTRANVEIFLPFSPIKVLKGDVIKLQAAIGNGGVGYTPHCFFTKSI